MRDRHLRYFDLLPDWARDRPVTIIGAGAVGSWAALALGKMGFRRLAVWDGDVVTEPNLGVQAYGDAALGKPKVTALAEELARHGASMTGVPRMYDGSVAFPGVVVSAVDKMDARRLIWEAHRRLGAAIEFIIDPRMGAEQALLFVVRPFADHEWYEKTLYDSSLAVQEKCTAKATIPCAMALGAEVAKVVRDAVVGDRGHLRSMMRSFSEDDFDAVRVK